MTHKHVLAIETSCDDTSVAIVREDGLVLRCLSANQDLAHQPFGGVVPEIASRNHTLQILPLLEELFKKTRFTWERLDGIAVTSRPGLIGSLLVGVVTAKTLALIHNKPILGINHLEAHLLAPFLYDERHVRFEGLDFPFLALAISGGHTQLCLVHRLGCYEVIGRTLDDAAGEAFDKFAKHLGMGFPGGALVDSVAYSGDRRAFRFPRTMIKEDGFNYSFSGLKSAAIRLIDGLPEDERASRRPDLCASFREAVVESLMARLDKAAKHYRMERIVLTGGVSANSRLREVASDWAQAQGRKLFIPPVRYCTDNAAMVGYAGILHLKAGDVQDQSLAAQAHNFPKDFI